VDKTRLVVTQDEAENLKAIRDSENLLQQIKQQISVDNWLRRWRNAEIKQSS
jgi:hypothetical protein